MSNRLRKHAKRHESGGLDEIDLANLAGTLGDAQATQFLLLDGTRGMTGPLDLSPAALEKILVTNGLGIYDPTGVHLRDILCRYMKPWYFRFVPNSGLLQTGNAVVAGEVLLQSVAVAPTYITCATLKGGVFSIERTGDIIFLAGKYIKNIDHLEGDEITTPTAVADHWKLYSKTDNKLYFQDGAGIEHEVSLV